ncbi:hypothetical protein C900_04202 [Fulvivirga imtechensis AK7]|uniref:Uncharacterized protein n=1 Tax=Fulvivirga imtechensis AK7 TaxID=1237149 RepID=L8JX40_9BACT|nr:fibronectin type III domain-containing protein [Fulvivirga imtechensis]ELR73350.1 hypothetical protein C900_04202 [Fulvivirga imtechensis AK7]
MKTNITLVIVFILAVQMVSAQVPKQHYFIVPGTMSYRLDATTNPPLSHPDTLVRGTYYGAASGGAMTGFNSSQYKDFSLFYHPNKADFITDPHQVDVLPKINNGGYNWSRWLLNFRMAYPSTTHYSYDTASKEQLFPLIIFMHGAGERADCWGGSCYGESNPRMWNNDHNVQHGGKQHLDAINRSPSDPRHWPGFVVFPQMKNGWNHGNGLGSYTARVIALVQQLIKVYPIDPNRVYIHGLSEGAQGAWMLFNSRPDLFAASAPMSGYKDYGVFSTDVVGMDTTMIHIPIWQIQGGKDTRPKPSSTQNKMKKLRNVGGTPRYTEYAHLGHATWNTAYAEPDFFSWFLQHSKLTIHGYYGVKAVCEGDEVNVRLGISKGFDAYEWRKIADGDTVAFPPSPERDNEIIADELASYQVRFARGAEWTEWSEPYTITSKTRPTAVVKATGSSALPGLDGATTVTLTTDQQGLYYEWYKDGNLYLHDSTLNAITVSDPGAYSLIVKDEGLCKGNESNKIYVSNQPYTGALPAKPENVHASPSSASSINIYWEDKSTDELGFEVYRSADGTNYSWVTTTGPNILMYSDTLLSSNKLYYYKVRAYNMNGPSAPSNVASAQTLEDDKKPTSPGNFVFKHFNYTEHRLNVTGSNLADEHFTVHTDEIVLSWEPSQDNVGVTEYEVYFSDGTLAKTTTSTETIITGLQKEAVYSFYVVAKDAAGNVSNPSNSISVTTVFEGLYFNLYGGGTWDVVKDFSDWAIFASGSVENFKISIKDGIYVDDDYFAFDFFGYIYITNSGEYTFYTSSDDGSQLWIGNQMVVNNDGVHGMQERSGKITLSAGVYPITVKYFERSGGHGLQVSYKGPGIGKRQIPDNVLKSGNKPSVTLPPAPTNVSATADNTAFRIDLSWSHSGSGNPKFEIYRSANGTNFSLIHTTATGIISYQDTELHPSTTYWYKLKAVNANGSSGFSSTVSATSAPDVAPPSIPQNVVVRSKSESKIALSWDNSVDNVGVTEYVVSYSTTGGGSADRTGTATRNSTAAKTQSQTATSNSNGITIEDLAPETEYTFTVSALDASGNQSGDSDPITATTLSDNPLPVDFVSFNYVLEGNDVVLKWTTTNEVNNDYFSIERAENIEQFTSIGEVEGSGNTDGRVDYEFRDSNPLNIAYYRIKQVDLDGQSTLSKTIRVTLTNVFEELTVYPNPASPNNINIKGYVPTEKDRINIRFYDTMGKSSLAIETDPNTLLEGLNIDARNNLHPGIYMVEISDGINKSQKRVIIR